MSEPLQKPKFRDPNQRSAPNAYEGRWRWWYAAIADWMISNPTGTIRECAVSLKKSYGTVQQIASTDMFKTYFAERRELHSRAHDTAIHGKLVALVEKSLDLTFDHLEKKGDTVPLKMLDAINVNILDRLGFAPKTSPSVAVNVQNNGGNNVVVQGVTPALLEEAREALRRSQRLNAEKPELLLTLDPVATAESGVGVEKPVAMVPRSEEEGDA